MRFIAFSIGGLIAVAAIVYGVYQWNENAKFPKPPWTEEEKRLISSLWIGYLPELQPDPSNRVADNPDAARLGHQIFFDKRFSSNGEVACVSCHHPDKYFTDDKALAVGVGVTSRSAPTIVGSAYHPFIFWDGRADSQWAQALGPMESAVEHGGTRMQYAHLIANDAAYRMQYEKLFGPMPDLSDSNRFPSEAGPVDAKSNPAAAEAWNNMTESDKKLVTTVYVNIGKALAAYERLMMPAPSRFDKYAESIINDDSDNQNILSRDEIEGLRLFIGEARCIECHNGPRFTNDGFANIGTPRVKGKPFDFGRSQGVQKLLKSEFNCLGEYSDAQSEDCAETRFVKRSGDDITGSFKTPTLRNITATAPYMHAGQLATLDDVMEHYNKAPKPDFGHNMLVSLDLEPHQLKQLTAFLHSLDSDIAADEEWLQPPHSTHKQAASKEHQP